VGATPENMKEKIMEFQAEYIFKGRLNGSQRNKVKGLLNMMYSPKELADEIGINKNQIYRVYLPLNCPHEKDSLGRISFHGLSFRIWYENLYRKVRLEKNQAWCVSCKKIVDVSDSKRYTKGRLIYDLSACPICGKCVAKIIDAKRKRNDL
jgi:hypothetical protein